MAKRTASPRQKAWRRSAEFHAVRVEALKRFNRQRLAGTRCGAKTKSTPDGRPCQQPAMENGRCHWHGGRVSRHWHVPDYERKNQPGAMDRAHAKLAKHEKGQQKRQRRVALMTPEERAKHQAWQKTHKPGPAGERARLRADRKAAAEFRKLADRPPSPLPPSNEEPCRLQSIAERRARIEDRKAGIAARRSKPNEGDAT